MLFHQSQLFACAFLPERCGARVQGGDNPLLSVARSVAR